MPLKNMHGDVPDGGTEHDGQVAYDRSPTHDAKKLNSMKAPYVVKRITFDKSEAGPGDKLAVRVPKLNENKTFNKRKNRALLTFRRSQKHYEIFSNNVFRKNITRKQLRLETIEIA